MGDSAPPPPPVYESPSDRRRALRESVRVTRRGGQEGVRPGYAAISSASRPIKSPGQVTPDRKSPSLTNPPVTTNQESDSLCAGLVVEMASQGRRKEAVDQSAGKDGKVAASGAWHRGGRHVAEDGIRAATNHAGLLMAPPAGWGDQGGLVERPSRPKPVGDPEVARLLRQRALLTADREVATHGNWDDGESEKNAGFRQGEETKIGGYVDMEDDVFLEFEEEEEVKKDPDEAPTWQLMARYMANFKPNTKAMFTRFVEEVWFLRTGIDYAEKGKNYYMITLYSKGDYDFVRRGGPWIYKKNALIVKDFDSTVQPSEIKLDAVPVWVRIYDVPFQKQDYTWGMRYGNGLGEALEVDVPESEIKKQEFLRVRVNLPYDRRLQTHITAGIKGKPEQTKVFKLMYERVPYYCSHCGFMGHKKDDCEKSRLGIPSLEYDAIELRCSPYKKFEYRSHSIPPAGHPKAKRGLSFSSFGSAESRKQFNRGSNYGTQRTSGNSAQSQPRSNSIDPEMPPLADDIVPGVIDADGQIIGQPVLSEEERRLADRIAELDMSPNQHERSGAESKGRNTSEPIIQFPDEDGQTMGVEGARVSVSVEMMAHVQRLQHTMRQGPGNLPRMSGPHASDMIPALQGLSSLQVSFGSVNDTSMPAADSVLGKRLADQEAQGELHDQQSDGHAEKNLGGTPKKGKLQDVWHGKAGQREVEVVYKRNKKTTQAGAKLAGKLARPNVWSRQQQ